MYTIAKAKDAIKNGIRGYLLKDKEGAYVMKEANRLPFYLEGAPGIGKTEIVKQIADELGIGYVSFSLVHHTRNSLLGLPVIQDLKSGAKYTCYTMSEIIAKVLEEVEWGHKEGILLLDEFPSMSETIVPTMLSFLQTKNIGCYTLPEGWVIVLCGNPRIYNHTAKRFDAAIVDRFRKLQVEAQPEVFLEYGESVGMHDAVLEYLGSHPKHVYRYKTCEGGDFVDLVTCRSWENLSHMLKTYETLGQEVDKDAIGQYLKSEEIAEAFHQFLVQYRTGVNRKMMEDIFSGTRLSKHTKTCMEMDYNGKRSLLDYMTGLLKKQHADLPETDECLEEAQNILKELDEVIVRASEADMNFVIYDASVQELVEFLENNDIIAFNTEERQKVIACLKEYETQNTVDDFLWDDEELDTEKEICKKFREKLNDWCLMKSSTVSVQYAQMADKIENLLKFVQKIDSGNMLAEMIFGQINKEPVFLKALSRCPKETYLKMCAARYDMNVS